MKKLSLLSKATIAVGGALVLSTLGTYLTNTSFMTVEQNVVTEKVSDLLTEIDENNKAYNKNYGCTLTTSSTKQLCFTIYRPRKATAQNKAPLIVCAHGNCNTKEMQFMNFVELSKRGYVVVTVDTATHGRTDSGITTECSFDLPAGTSTIFGDPRQTIGTLCATEYAMSLPYVDETKVGITGHSGGNAALVGVALAFQTYRDKAAAYAALTPEEQATSADKKYAGFSKKVSAFWCPSGTAAFYAMFGLHANEIYLGTASGKYDELDTAFFGTGDAATQSNITKQLYAYYTTGNKANSANIGAVPLNEWHDSTGAVVADPEPGQQLSTDHGLLIMNPEYTHPGSQFCVTGARNVVNFFYAAFGTPSGAKFKAASRQTWWISMMFQIIGLIAFFATAIVAGAWLLKRKKFAIINAEVNGEFERVIDQKKLPSIKNWREIVPIAVTFIPLVVLPFFYYVKCMNNAASRLVVDSYFSASTQTMYVTFIAGVIAWLFMAVNRIAKSCCYIKHDAERTPFISSTLKLNSWKQFGYTIIFALEVVGIMYIPQIIAYFGFDVIFQAAVYGVGVPKLVWLPEILLTFLPFFLVYTLANGALNAATRFKEVPEWASTLFCVVANLLPYVILTIICYSKLTTDCKPWTDSLGNSYMSNPSIYTWNFWAPAIFVGITSRYFYKKTGNVWAGAIVCALVLALMNNTLTKHYSEYLLVLVQL